jgi:hypothetical protein
MANRPVNTGSGGAAAPPPVHHDAIPSPPSTSPAPGAARPARGTTASAPGAARPARGTTPGGHRARSRSSRRSRDTGATAAGGLAWLPYLIVLAGVATGMFVTWQGSKYASRGAGIIGASLLAGALFRLILPARYAGLLSSRRKASDVLALAVLGAAVLAVAISLP